MNLTIWARRLGNRSLRVLVSACVLLAVCAPAARGQARQASFTELLQQYRQGNWNRYDTNTSYEGEGDGPPAWASNFGRDYVTLDLPVAQSGFAAAGEHQYTPDTPASIAAIGQPCMPQPVRVRQFLNDENVLRYQLLRRAQMGDAPPVPAAALVAFDTGKQWAQAAQTAASPMQAEVDGKNAVAAFVHAIDRAPWVGLYYYDAGVAARPIWHDVKPNAILLFDWYLLTADSSAPQAAAARAAIAAIQVEAQTKYCESFDFSNVWNPVAWAVASGDGAAVRRRLGLGAEVSQHWAGLNLLGIAAATGDLGMVRLLMTHGADPNNQAVNTQGADQDDCSSAMCAAAEMGRLAVLRYFLAHGAAVTPDCVAYAAATGHMAVAQLLAAQITARGMDRYSDDWKSPLAYAVASGKLATLRWILSRYPPGSKQVQTALLWAALYGRSDMVELVLEHGGDANYNACLKGEWTIAHSETCVWWEEPLIAASVGDSSPSVVRELLAHGAKVNQMSPDLFSPLDAAAGNGREQIAALLIEAGAEVNGADRWGDTPLMDAVQSAPSSPDHNLKLIQLLVEHGASVNVHDKQGRSVLSLAQSPAVVAYLRAHGAQ